MTDLQLALLRELVASDEALAVELAELESLADDTAAVRERADALAALLARADAERARLAAAVEQAERDLAERDEALNDAESELALAESKGDEERLAAARRFVVSAGDSQAVARRRVVAVRAEARAFADRVLAAEREVPEIEARAAAVAESLKGRPRLAESAGHTPGPGLIGIIEWASGARAALVVARTAVATEREALIRQANELGSAILGEPLYAANSTVVAATVESALRPAPGR